jgi:hypothetical protein
MNLQSVPLACVRTWLMSGSLTIEILDFIVIFLPACYFLDSLLHDHISRIVGAHPNDYYGLLFL